jgi:transposase-like protein
MKGNRFDPDFKEDIAQLHINGNRTCVSLAEKLDMRPNALYKWVQQYDADPEQAFPASGNPNPMRKRCGPSSSYTPD